MEADIFSTIERIIETPFVKDVLEIGSLCLESDDELRAEFRLQFTTYDVVNYVYGVVHQLYCMENNEIDSISFLKIRYPVSATFFWQYSAIGRKIRIEHPIQEMELISLSDLNWGSYLKL